MMKISPFSIRNKIFIQCPCSRQLCLFTVVYFYFKRSKTTHSFRGRQVWPTSSTCPQSLRCKGDDFSAGFAGWHTLEVQPPFSKGCFPKHRYLSRGLSSSKSNHHFQNGGWLPGTGPTRTIFPIFWCAFLVFFSGQHEKSTNEKLVVWVPVVWIPRDAPLWKGLLL